MGRFSCLPGGLVPVVILPTFVATRSRAGLAGRPPGPPAAIAPARHRRHPSAAAGVRLDAVAAVLLDGLSYRRAGRAVGISKTEVGDSLDLLLGELGALGFCQPDGTFITTLDDLRHWLSEMAAAGEATVVDGLVTRVQRPCGWANQKVLYDAKRHTHTAQGLAVSTSGETCCGSTVAGRDRASGQRLALRRWRLYRVRDVFRAAGVLICLCRWRHRVPHMTTPLGKLS
jgi:hypothetical protein